MLNCHRFKTRTEAWEAYVKEDANRRFSSPWDFVDWLFSPYKGGGGHAGK